MFFLKSVHKSDIPKFKTKRARCFKSYFFKEFTPVLCTMEMVCGPVANFLSEGHWHDFQEGLAVFEHFLLHSVCTCMTLAQLISRQAWPTTDRWLNQHILKTAFNLQGSNLAHIIRFVTQNKKEWELLLGSQVRTNDESWCRWRRDPQSRFGARLIMKRPGSDKLSSDPDKEGPGNCSCATTTTTV